ncbi:MAG: hypothetical protein U0L88_11825 [Acutalibacteraceae bacterium]|jgi:hypothetical protein|nr:hypothetical protein [Acutalibacteraceae bacterium]
MALFNNPQKQQEKLDAMLKKYNLTELSDPADLESVKKIAAHLAGNNLINLGTTLSGKAEDVAKLTYLAALVEQNWIIIRQLDRLNKNIEAKE